MGLVSPQQWGPWRESSGSGEVPTGPALPALQPRTCHAPWAAGRTREAEPETRLPHWSEQGGPRSRSWTLRLEPRPSASHPPHVSFLKAPKAGQVEFEKHYVSWSKYHLP